MSNKVLNHWHLKQVNSGYSVRVKALKNWNNRTVSVILTLIIQTLLEWQGDESLTVWGFT